MFNKDYVLWTKKLEWSWGTYGVICERGLGGPCSGQGANPTESFQQAAEQDRTALSMAF